MKNEKAAKPKPLSLSAFGKTLSPRMSCEGLRNCIARGRLTKGLVIVNGKTKVENPELAARELAKNSRKPREHVPVLSYFEQCKTNSEAEYHGTHVEIFGEMLDYHALATELAMLVFQGGTTEEELAAHMAPFAGTDLPDNVLEYVQELAQAADELAEERRENPNH